MPPVPRMVFAVNGNDFHRSLGQRRNPIGKAALERQRVERGENIAKPVMRRGPVGERQKAAQQRQLLLAKPRHVGEAFRVGQHGKQPQQQHFVERVNDLPGLTGVWQVLEIIQKNRRLAKRTKVRKRIRHCRSPLSDSVEHDRFSTSSVCHILLHPIALDTAPKIH